MQCSQAARSQNTFVQFFSRETMLRFNARNHTRADLELNCVAVPESKSARSPMRLRAQICQEILEFSAVAVGELRQEDSENLRSWGVVNVAERRRI